jgi:hypothetical protein
MEIVLVHCRKHHLHEQLHPKAVNGVVEEILPSGAFGSVPAGLDCNRDSDLVIHDLDTPVPPGLYDSLNLDASGYLTNSESLSSSTSNLNASLTSKIQPAAPLSPLSNSQSYPPLRSSGSAITSSTAASQTAKVGHY